MASSSSSAEPIGDLLAESLALLEREAPECARRLAARLRGLPVDLSVDREALALQSDGARVRLAPPGDDPAPVALVTTRAVIAAVLDGRLLLTDAVLADRIAVRGPLSDLLTCHAALQDYVHGAVRSPSFPALLDRFRARLGASP